MEITPLLWSRMAQNGLGHFGTALGQVGTALKWAKMTQKWTKLAKTL